MKTNHNISKLSKLRRWELLTEKIKNPLLHSMVKMAKISTTNPITTVAFVILFSFGSIIIGFHTNFSLETDNRVLWSPSNSITALQGKWVMSPESGFPSIPRKIIAIVHSNGENVLKVNGMNHMFDVVDLVRNTEGYSELCLEEKDGIALQRCQLSSPTGFWLNHNRTVYEEEVQTDEDLRKSLSKFRTADTHFVNRLMVIGEGNPPLTFRNFQVFMLKEHLGGVTAVDMQNSTVMDSVLEKAAKQFELKSAKSFLLIWDIPETERNKQLALNFERQVVNEIVTLNQKWAEQGDEFVISVSSRSSVKKEILRGILNDIPLMISAFIIMILFTTYSLSKYHRIKSQTSLGIGAIFSIFLAIINGYGLMFCMGIPLTSLTYLFPYAMLGLGLDDTFIILESLKRRDSSKNMVDRMEETICDIGLSIAISTMTTVIAYFLGSTSSLPGVRWFCMYASTVIIIDFVYQLTFFSALIVLDDRRQKSNRLDFLFCLKAQKIDERNADNEQFSQNVSFAKKLIESYAKFLLKPKTKQLVIILFAIFFTSGAWYASGISSELDERQLLPADSHVLKYVQDLESYGGGGETLFQFVGVYFRDVDVSDPEIQNQMTKYVNDLAKLPYITSPPFTFWLRDFKYWRNANNETNSLDFYSQLDLFFKVDLYKDLYLKDIVRDESGLVVSSRTRLSFDQVDPFNINQQTQAFLAQRRVTEEQSINKGSADANFFAFGNILYSWELWNTLPKEIASTIVLGLTSVFILCLIFIPHPIGTIILTPTVAATFAEVIAVLRFAGLNMNAITAIGIITSIGLIVDYSIHVCVAYFENENAETSNDRVEQTIVNMGIPILKGGFTTFLGVIPMILNSTLGFRTFFVTFVGITTLGVAHGLIFLPVVLSIVGTYALKDNYKDLRSLQYDNEHELEMT